MTIEFLKNFSNKRNLINVISQTNDAAVSFFQLIFFADISKGLPANLHVLRCYKTVYKFVLIPAFDRRSVRYKCIRIKNIKYNKKRYLLSTLSI